MPDLTVIVPTRNRPHAVVPLAEAFRSTCTADTLLLYVIDETEPQRAAYFDALTRTAAVADLVVTPASNMAGALNNAATTLTGFAVGFLGDDHMPRTVGWDAAYLDALREMGTGVVYGNDLLQGERLPTQVAMTTNIVQSLGWMTPPGLAHLFLDNWWLDLGRAAGCIRYLPDVIVEHRHPVAGKAAWDDGYARVNDGSMYQRDGQAYADFVSSGGFATAVEKVRALRGELVG